jgi:hypothetical protein
VAKVVPNAAQFREDVVEVARSICEESVEKLLENFPLFSFFGDRKHCAEAAEFFCLLLGGRGRGRGRLGGSL